jgi:hypothetical protein
MLGMGVVADNAHTQHSRSFCAAFFKKRLLSSERIFLALPAGSGAFLR